MNDFLLLEFQILGVYCTRKWQKKKQHQRRIGNVIHRTASQPKNFPINFCIYHVTHASSNSAGLHQVTPTTTTVRLSTAYNNSQHHTATVNILLHQLTHTSTTVRLSTAFNNSQHHTAAVYILLHPLTPTTTTVQLSTTYNNSQHHTATMDILLHHLTTTITTV